MIRPQQTLTLLAAAALTAAVATGCQTTNPYTGEAQMTRTSRNALIGAGIGVAAGLLTGDSAVERRQRALVGAGIGGLAGGAIGAYQDRQQAALREQLQGTGVSVTRNGDNITLNMPSSITFALNSADLNSQFFSALDGVAMVLKEYDKTVIEIAGHTDSTGSEQYNQQLSERRAQSVARYLISQGVAPQRLITVGGGELYPIASNDTEAGRAANRRVELTIVPVTKG